MTAKDKARLSRAKMWTFLVFGETLEEIELLRDWLLKWRASYLDILKVGFAVSPVHKPDVKRSKKNCVGDTVTVLKDTEDTKFHLHVVVSFGSLKSWEQVDSGLDFFIRADLKGRRRGVTRAFPVDNPTGIIRYLIHLDDRDKQQFTDNEIEKVRQLSTIDLEKYWILELSSDEKEIFLETCEELILTGEVVSISELIARYKADKIRRALIRRNFNFFMGLFREVRSYGGWLRSEKTEKADKLAERAEKIQEAQDLLESLKPSAKSKKSTESDVNGSKVFDIFTNDGEDYTEKKANVPISVSGSTAYNAYTEKQNE